MPPWCGSGRGSSGFTDVARQSGDILSSRVRRWPSTRIPLDRLIGGPVGVEFHLLAHAPVAVNVTVMTEVGDPVPER